MNKKQSELTVVTRTKDLCSYIMTVTQKCPKNFRYTYVLRLQNLTMDIIENIFRANDTFVSKGDASSYNIRLEFQHKALTDLKLLAYFSMLAMEQKCLLPNLNKYRGICRRIETVSWYYYSGLLSVD